jgi:hypothetical protein
MIVEYESNGANGCGPIAEPDDAFADHRVPYYRWMTDTPSRSQLTKNPHISAPG